MSMNLGPLFEPFELHNLKLRNRVAMAPMTRNFSPDGVPGKTWWPIIAAVPKPVWA